MRLSALLVFGALCVALAPNVTAAQSAIDPNARVVELRASCLMPGATYLDNCFETTDDLTDWLWVNAGLPGGRNSEPNALDEVVVRVGPGTFDPFVCRSTAGVPRGFVSVVGSGRDVTHFVQTNVIVDFTAFVCEGGISAIDCESLSFSDLSASGPATGVLWLGAGDSFWEDVDMRVDNDTGLCLGRTYAWFDMFGASTETTPAAKHWFWDARLEARGILAAATFSTSSESWVYASDLLLRVAAGGGSGSYPAAVRTGSSDGVRIFGSSVRAVGEPGVSGNVAGLQSVGPGAIHMHGGIINVNATNTTTGVAVGASTDSTLGFVHTLETAFNLSGAFPIRIYGPGTIQSPFIWPRGPNPPEILSETGADFFVKTNEGPGQDEPRLFVWDLGCSTVKAEQWRSVTTGNCI